MSTSLILFAGPGGSRSHNASHRALVAGLSSWSATEPAGVSAAALSLSRYVENLFSQAPVIGPNFSPTRAVLASVFMAWISRSVGHGGGLAMKTGSVSWGHRGSRRSCCRFGVHPFTWIADVFPRIQEWERADAAPPVVPPILCPEGGARAAVFVLPAVPRAWTSPRGGQPPGNCAAAAGAAAGGLGAPVFFLGCCPFAVALVVPAVLRLPCPLPLAAVGFVTWMAVCGVWLCCWALIVAKAAFMAAAACLSRRCFSSFCFLKHLFGLWRFLHVAHTGHLSLRFLFVFSADIPSSIILSVLAFMILAK